jgi:hypothetical protein
VQEEENKWNRIEILLLTEELIGELERAILYRSLYLAERVEDFTESLNTRVREVKWIYKEKEDH